MNSIEQGNNSNSSENRSSKLIAVINSRAPYSSTSGKDALDVALIFGSYEQEVSLFFHGDGVFQLIEKQNSMLIQLKDYLKTFSAFEFYDIEKIYVCQKSLQNRCLTDKNFHIDNAVVLNTKAFNEKLHQHNIFFRF